MNLDFLLTSALIEFLLLNGVLSTLALGVERLTRRTMSTRWSERRRSRCVFGLAVAPFALSVVMVVGLQLPAQLLYEPHETTEYVTVKMFLMALAGLLGGGAALTRQLASWILTERFHSQAIQVSQPLSSSVGGASLPIYRIKHCLPLCCLFGVRRPQLFLSEQLFRILDLPELRSAVAHEESHWRRRDNLKLFWLNALKNFFFFLPPYRRLVKAWQAANEMACDEEAALTRSPLDLASALLKIARLTPDIDPSPAMLRAGLGLIDFRSSAFLEERISRLLLLADHPPSAELQWRPSPFSWMACAGAFSGLVLLMIEHNILYSLHRGIEVLERWFM